MCARGLDAAHEGGSALHIRHMCGEKRGEPTVTASHILLTGATGGAAKLEALKPQCGSAAAFKQLATQHSKCPMTGKLGGHLGTFARGRMAAPFDAACFDARARVGEVIGPVGTSSATTSSGSTSGRRAPPGRGVVKVAGGAAVAASAVVLWAAHARRGGAPEYDRSRRAPGRHAPWRNASDAGRTP